ncbi:hypothetical protein DFJ74DRAFT_745972 [Hyaloraphidium curvatum]|nr:hypothetical protein DFJ74DRAFT_745972 [Hyaloraphidium curvatum]
MRLRFALLVLAGLVAAAAADEAPVAVQPPLQTAFVCHGAEPVVAACPAGTAIAVADAFYGGDDELSLDCPAAPTDCAHPPARAAAVVLAAARVCNGKPDCALAQDALLPVGDPCIGVNKAIRLRYECVQPAAAVAPSSPPSDAAMFARRPGTYAGAGCPSLQAALDAGNRAGYRFVKDTEAPIRLQFADLDLTQLDAKIREATGGALGVDTAANIDIVAVNVLLPAGSAVSIGRHAKAKVALSITAINIVAGPGSRLVVYSLDERADPLPGPDVIVRAARIMGELHIDQNGLGTDDPVGPKVGPFSYKLNPYNGPKIGADGQPNYGLGTHGLANMRPENLLVRQIPIRVASHPDDCNGTLLCTTDPANYDAMSPSQELTGLHLQTFYARTWPSAAPQGQKFARWGTNADRFSWPGKDAWGSVDARVGGFLPFDGEGAPSASGVRGERGIAASAEHEVRLEEDPAQMSEIPGGVFRALREVNAARMRDPEAVPELNYIKHEWLRESFGRHKHFRYEAVHTPLLADPEAWGGPAPEALEILELCLAETVSASRFAEAAARVADLADVLPDAGGDGDPAASAAVGRILGAHSGLLTGRREQAIAVVPYLSVDAISGRVSKELEHLLQLEAEVGKINAQASSVDVARQAVRLGTVAVEGQVANYEGELAASQTFITALQQKEADMQKAYDALQPEMEAAAANFKKALEKKLAIELTFAAVALIGEFSNALFVFSAARKAVNVLKDVKENETQAKRAFTEMDKLVKVLELIGKSIQQLRYLSRAIQPVYAVAIATHNSKPIMLSKANITEYFSTVVDSGSLSTLATSALGYQELKDAAYIAFQPAVALGVSAATNVSQTMAKIANVGAELVATQTQLLSAMNAHVLSAYKLQSARKQAELVAKDRDDLDRDAQALVRAAFRLNQAMIAQKGVALARVYEACRAYEFAQTRACPVELPGLDSPAGDFARQIESVALEGLKPESYMSQCYCGAAFNLTDPALIADLRANASATVDLTGLYRDSHLAVLDNVHLARIDVRPHGVAPPEGASKPVLSMVLSTDGYYLNTDSVAGTKAVRSFLAPGFTVANQVRPTVGWQVLVAGRFTDQEAARFFSATPFARFALAEHPLGEKWDWSGVEALEVVLSGWGRASTASSWRVGEQTMVGNTCGSCW